MAETTFRLGRCCFRIMCRDAGLAREIARLLPRAPVRFEPAIERLDIDLDRFQAAVAQHADLEGEGARLALCVNFIIGQALAFHQGFLWLEAAALVDGDGAAIVLCGPSGAGKTTLSLALALSGRGRLISEDVLLIDPVTLAMVPLARPSSVRPGAWDLIDAAIGGTCAGGAWHGDERLYASEEQALRPRAFFLLAPPAAAVEPLSLTEIEGSACARHLLALSNALRLPDGAGALDRFVGQARCYIVRGGDLKERIETVASSRGSEEGGR